MPYKNAEKRKQLARKRVRARKKNNSDKARAQKRKYNKKNRKRLNKAQAEWVAKNQDK